MALCTWMQAPRVAEGPFLGCGLWPGIPGPGSTPAASVPRQTLGAGAWAGALGRPLASFAAFAASAERCSHSGPRSHASLASRPWTLIVLPDRDLRVTGSTRSTPRSIHCSCVLFAPLFRAPGGVRVECALATFATTRQASPARNTNSSLVQANSHVLANLPQCCPRIRSAAGSDGLPVGRAPSRRNTAHPHAQGIGMRQFWVHAGEPSPRPLPARHQQAR